MKKSLLAVAVAGAVLLSEAAHEKRESVSNKIRKLKLSRFN